MMTPGFAKTRAELPGLPYPEKDRVIINAHNFTPSAWTPAVNGKNPIAAWVPSRDDFGNGTVTLNDLTGNGYDGTLTLMDAATDWVADTDAGGVRALEFDGVNDRVITTLDLLDGAVTKTISMWINPLTTGSNAQFDAYAGSQSSVTARLHVFNSGSFAGNDDIAFAIANGANSGGYTTGNVLTNNTWKHWVFVFDGAGANNAARCRIFCNAVQQTLSFFSTIPSSLPTASAAFNLASINASAYSLCRLDDIRIFSEALDATDISDLYASGNGRGVQA